MKTLSYLVTQHRFAFLLSFLGLMLLLGGGRLFFLSLKETQHPIDDNFRSSQTISSLPRGSIVDRFGFPLATSSSSFRLIVNPQKITPKMVDFLKTVLQKNTHFSEERLQRKVTQNKKYWVIEKEKTPDFVNHLGEIYSRLYHQSSPSLRAFNRRLYQEGVWLEREHHKRYYPLGENAGSLIGLVNQEGKGQFGVEKLFDKALTQEESFLQVRRDAKGRVIEYQDIDEVPKLLSNEAVKLSIDARLQTMLHQSLKKVAITYGASVATAVLVDIKTGELLALDSIPSFDPNDRSQLKIDSTAALVFSDIYEPGSVMKPLVIAEAIDDLNVSLETKVKHTSSYRYGKRVVFDDFPTQGYITLKDIIVRSSNVGISHVAEELGQKNMKKLFSKMGIDYPSVNFPGSSPGITPRYDAKPDWISSAYGYAVALSSAHLVSAYQAIANDGVHVPLRITPLKPKEKPQGKRMFSISSARQVKEALKAVVQRGTGRRARIDGYQIGGKTGTVRRLLKGKYSRKQLRTLFVGIAPIGNPDMVLLVVLDTKQRVGGGIASAPVASKIMQKALIIRGIYPSGVPIP